MHPLNLHPWNVTPREAIAIQNELRGRVVREGEYRGIHYVAGADIAWDRLTKTGYVGVIVFRYPSLEVVEEVTLKGPADFPYVPGLLTFREAPLVLEAFSRLTIEPDVVFIDGQGVAHPRRIGIASHLGLCLNKPTIGCAKSRLIGEYREPGLKRGSRSRLMDKGEVIGVVLRTRDNVNPIFVSVGHLISLPEAIRLTLRCNDGYRIPKPTRFAHQLVGRQMRQG
jgi:deoxyribonuclease V